MRPRDRSQREENDPRSYEVARFLIEKKEERAIDTKKNKRDNKKPRNVHVIYGHRFTKINKLLMELFFVLIVTRLFCIFKAAIFEATFLAK